ncbi:MAG: hypothetical protein ACREU2_09910 [Steroidobacteraceae bacterium]
MPLDFSVPRRPARPPRPAPAAPFARTAPTASAATFRRTADTAADAPATPSRYLTRREAAAYVRCSLRFLDGLALPYIRKGRCKLYDRIDLDERMQQDKCRGRAWKEILWPVNVDSTAARIRGTGGLPSFSRMDDAYAKALGVSIAPPLKPSPSA